MSISTIDANKELAVGYPTVLLVSISFFGTSTQPISVLKGGCASPVFNSYTLTYGGNVYQSRLAQQELGCGAGVLPARPGRAGVCIQFTTWPTAIRAFGPTLLQTYGFQGALMTCTLVQWDPVTGNFIMADNQDAVHRLL